MKKFTVLIALALLVLCGTSYAADRAAAPTMEPATVTVAPVLDRQAIVAAGIDNSIDENIVALESKVPAMLTEEVAGKWGLVSIVSMAGVAHQVFLRPIAPCRIVDTRVDGGPFVNGETRKYLLPGGVRCTSAIPSSVTTPSADGVVVLLEVNLEATEYPWSWGDNGPVFDFVGQPYSPDWFGMHGERGFLFATNEGDFPNTARGKIRGFVALKRFPGLFSSLWGLEAQVKSQWAKADFRAHITIDVVGYATPTFTR